MSNDEKYEAMSLRTDQFLISRTSLSGVITYANQAFADAIGMSVEAVVGMKYSQLFDPETPDHAVRDVRETTATRGLRWHGVTRLRRPDGQTLWAKTHVSPVIENGHVVRFTSVRTRAEPDEIAFVERMYERMRTAGWTIHNGRFIGPGPIGFIRSCLGKGMRGDLMTAQLPSLICLVASAVVSATQTASQISWLIWSIVAAAIVGALGTNFWFLKRWLAPLEDATDCAHRIASGDLSATLVSNASGESRALFEAFTLMRRSLESMILEVSEGVRVISLAASEIADGNADLSGRTENQAASLEQTASSMQQFTMSVKQNADNATRASRMAESVSTTAKTRGEAFLEVVRMMSRIDDSVRQIGQITGLIEGIASQTNILALNAAVEAARAGQHGRGFAVVASEVRALAQRSAAASKEIETLVAESIKRATHGSSLVQSAAHAMGEIATSVGQITDLIGEISGASVEQSQGISQVEQAISHMDQTTQQNAALVEQASAAATSLSNQAQILWRSIGVFHAETTA